MYRLDAESGSVQQHLWDPLEVDLFATRLSAQLPRFYGWKPEPLAERVDTFLQDWSTVRGYAHPPWCLISRCLKKTKDQQATLVLITPNWSAQPWFSVALMMSIDYPRCVPQQNNLLMATANASNANSAESGHMAHFWRSLTDKGFSSEVEDLLSSSWRKGTHKNYDSAWKKWEQCCINKHASPISSFLNDILLFLTDQFHAGHSYRSLNVYHFAISSIHSRIDGYTIGSHHLVCS